jgi:hypothetical protein
MKHLRLWAFAACGAIAGMAAMMAATKINAFVRFIPSSVVYKFKAQFKFIEQN